MTPRRVRPGARDRRVARGRRVLLALGVALLAVGVVLMHSVGPHTGGPGHGGAVHAAPAHHTSQHDASTHHASTHHAQAHDAPSHEGQRVVLSHARAPHADAGGGVCLAVLPGLLALVLLAVSRRVRAAAVLLVSPLPRVRLTPARAPPRPTHLTLTRLCVLRT